LLPAFATPGCRSTWIWTVEVLGAQTPLVTLHCRVLVPEVKPEILVVGEALLPSMPPPDKTDQVPVPSVGEIAARFTLAELIQMV